MSNSILAKLQNMKKSTGSSSKVEMTPEQVQQCKTALKRDLRGPAVQPNKWDINQPYRVTVNFDEKWSNFGQFKSADVAAAVGSLVSASFFGDKALAGTYDEKIVEASEEFVTWLGDSRNAEVLARVNAGTSLLGDRNQAAPATATLDDSVF
jgi:hypothetical protein